MECIEIGDDRQLNELVAAVERGDEVILVRAGTPVARLQAPAHIGAGSLNRAALTEVRRQMLSLKVNDAGRLIRELRDASDH